MYRIASGFMQTAYTVPVSPTRLAARTVNQPDPAPISATVFPEAIPTMSITRLICSLSSLPSESKMERSPVYGVLVLRCSDCRVTALCDLAVMHWNCRSRTTTTLSRFNMMDPIPDAGLLDAGLLPAETGHFRLFKEPVITPTC